MVLSRSDDFGLSPVLVPTPAEFFALSEQAHYFKTAMEKHENLSRFFLCFT